MPFGPYDDFADCVAKNRDKSDPEAYCATIHKQTTGKWPAEMSMPEKARVVYQDAVDHFLERAWPVDGAYQMGQVALEQAGWKRHDGQWHFQVAPTVLVTGIEIFAAGDWIDSGGQKLSCTTTDLDNLVRNFRAHTEPVHLKVGHTSDDFNSRLAVALNVPPKLLTGEQGKGQLSLGRMSALERHGDKLVASFENVPQAIADLIKGGQFSAVSVELENGKDAGGYILTGVALLGAELPAIDTLADIRTAGVYAKRIAVFKLNKGVIIMPETLDQELQTIETEVSARLQGKQGERTFKSLWASVVEQFRRKGAASAAEPKAEPKAEVKPMTEPNADVLALQKRLDTAERYIATLEHDKRVIQYTKLAESWRTIARKPEDLGRELAEIHEAAGEKTAANVVAHYAAAHKAAEEGGLLTIQGRSRATATDDTPDEFEVKVREYAKAQFPTDPRGFERALAVLAVREDTKHEFAEYRKRVNQVVKEDWKRLTNGAGR